MISNSGFGWKEKSTPWELEVSSIYHGSEAEIELILSETSTGGSNQENIVKKLVLTSKNLGAPERENVKLFFTDVFPT